MRSTLAALPKDKRGYIIPWFVTEKKPNGEPDFTRIHPMRPALAWSKRVCWICGGGLDNLSTFACGPVSMATGTIAEPPGHLDCMRYAAQTCPFMLLPNYTRTFDGHPGPGVGIARNPKVTILLTTSNPRPKIRPDGILYMPGLPWRLERWREGRKATQEEYDESLTEGWEKLLELAKSADDVAAIGLLIEQARGFTFT